MKSWRGRPDAAARRARRRRPETTAIPEAAGPGLPRQARDKDLVLHIGLHKTASSFVQGLLAASRDDLLAHGVLYPTTGIVDKAEAGTREGAGSGQALLSRPGRQHALKSQLFAEIPDGVSTVLISSEEFGRVAATPTPARLVARFSAFRSIQVVLVLRRQDEWIESYYKQVVDQFRNFETRSFVQFLHEAGPRLLDFHARFSPWRDLVGPENFHVLSYDDLPDGVAICRRLLEIAGVEGPVLDGLGSIEVPRYDSVRAIDTVGLRILNAYRLEDRETRTRTACSIYDVAPSGDIELLTPGLRDEIKATWDPVNARIEDEWLSTPAPGFRFGSAPPVRAATAPSGPDMIDYLDRVIALCEDARTTPAPEAGSEDGEDE
jgi:hypothetical protein